MKINTIVLFLAILLGTGSLIFAKANSTPDPIVNSVPLALPPPFPADANIFVNLAKKIIPSVVNISSITMVKNSPYSQGPTDDMLRKFFGDLFRQYNRNGRG